VSQAVAIPIVVPGLLGRMGRLLVQAAHDDARTALAGATVRPGRAEVGQNVSAMAGGAGAGVIVTADLSAALRGVPAGQGVVIDFTTPGSTALHAAACAAHGTALIVGTTGLDDAARAALSRAAETVPVLLAANLSVGAHVAARLAALSAQAMPWTDAEIVELHHNKKKDAPSGTALLWAHAVAQARGQDPAAVVVDSRAGHAPRQQGDIGVFGVRGGDVVGEHTVYFFGNGERVEVTHRVSDRRIFATGAIEAAVRLRQRGPGLTTMAALFGL
jgi:4-hydroxy-tetrahydrodipicolinate reductase